MTFIGNLPDVKYFYTSICIVPIYTFDMVPGVISTLLGRQSRLRHESVTSDSCLNLLLNHHMLDESANSVISTK